MKSFILARDNPIFNPVSSTSLLSFPIRETPFTDHETQEFSSLPKSSQEQTPTFLCPAGDSLGKEEVRARNLTKKDSVNDSMKAYIEIIQNINK